MKLRLITLLLIITAVRILYFYIKFKPDYIIFVFNFLNNIHDRFDDRSMRLIGRSTWRFAPIEVPAYNYFPRTHMSIYLSIVKK